MVLIISLLSYFLTALCVSIVTTGLIKIASDLHLNQYQLSWVQNAYGLAFGSLILLSGKLSDAYGRKVMLNGALIVFAGGSLLAGLTHNIGWMLLARFIQGIGAAVLAPTAMSLLVDYFEGPELVRALAWYSSIAGLGSSVGLVLGGILASYYSWRIGFIINLPLAVLILLLSLIALKPHQRTAHPRFDFLGTLFSMLGIGLVVYSASGAAYGLSYFGLALILLVVFVLRERRAADPIMPLQLFKNSIRVRAYLARILFVGATNGFWYFISEELQKVFHYSPLQAGIAFLPMTIVLFLTAVYVPRIVNRIGNEQTLFWSALTILIGFALLLLFDKDNYLLAVAIPMVFFGVGQGLGLTPLTNLGIVEVKQESTGATSGVINTAQQIGGVLGVALMVHAGALFTTSTQMNVLFQIAMGVGMIMTIGYLAIALTYFRK